MTPLLRIELIDGPYAGESTTRSADAEGYPPPHIDFTLGHVSDVREPIITESIERYLRLRLDSGTGRWLYRHRTADVTRATFHGLWPLTVDEARIVVGQRNDEALGVVIQGTTYALNGTGKSWEQWPDLGFFQADGEGPGVRADLADLINYAYDFAKSRPQPPTVQAM